MLAFMNLSGCAIVGDMRTPPSHALGLRLSSFRPAVVITGWLLMLLPACAHAQGGVPLWTNRYDGLANIYDQATAIAVDSGGNVFVTGGSYNNPTNRDYATIKYSNSGVPLWTNRYNGPANSIDHATAIAVDSGGNVFVTGFSWNGSSTNSDYATVAYSSAGLPLWTNRYDGAANNSNDRARAIAVDSSGNVIVTGYSITNAANGDYGDYATIAYSNSGVPLWTNRYNGPGNAGDVANAIAVDPDGNVFVTGFSRSSRDQFTDDYAAVAYSRTGDLLWINRYNRPGNSSDIAYAIALDSDGNVFVTGSSLSNATNADYTTIKYSNSGVPLWTNRYDGPGSGSDLASAIAVDSSGKVFVTGFSAKYPRIADFGYVTIGYSNSGVPLWTNRYDGPTNGTDEATAIAVDSSGNVIVTGATAPSNNGYVTIAYSNPGVPLWTNQYNGGPYLHDVALAIVADRSGNVFVTGYSAGTNSEDYATIKYSSSVPRPRLDFQLLNNELVLSWSSANFSLQSASALTGPFTDLPGAASPYTNAFTTSQQFFRLKEN